MFSVYVLRCGDGGLYIGFTGDVDGRLKRHKAGAVPATRRRLPVELVYREEFGTRVEAMGRERKLKRGWGVAQTPPAAG